MPPLLKVEGLVKEFLVEKGFLSMLLSKKRRFVHAVSNISFTVDSGETLGLVGESGCGKTTVGKCILRLIEPTRGRIFFKDVDLCSLDKKAMDQMRKEMQIIFQDPFSSLNPRLKVRTIIGRPLELHGLANGAEVERRVAKILKSVGLSEEHINRYPHQFSGGQRQRIAIARAIAVNPSFIVADEPTSALDVSIQSSILNLLQDLKDEYGFSCLFISHDLLVVEYISDRVAVMYLGKIVELASKEELFDHPLHPYTKALLSSVPIPDPEIRRERIILKGEVPSPIDPPPGCRFHTRCPYAMPICRGLEPPFKDVGNHHFVACHLFA